MFSAGVDVGCFLDGTFFMTLTANVSVVLVVVVVVLLSYRSQAHHVDHGDLADTEEEEIEFVRAIFMKFGERSPSPLGLGWPPPSPWFACRAEADVVRTDPDNTGLAIEEVRLMADKGRKTRNFYISLRLKSASRLMRFQQTHGTLRVFSRP